MYTCTHTRSMHANTHTHTCMYTCTHTRSMHANTHTHMHVHMHTHTHTHVHMHTHTRSMHANTHMHAHAHTHTHKHMYIHTHTYTHTHTLQTPNQWKTNIVFTFTTLLDRHLFLLLEYDHLIRVCHSVHKLSPKSTGDKNTNNDTHIIMTGGQTTNSSETREGELWLWGYHKKLCLTRISLHHHSFTCVALSVWNSVPHEISYWFR